MYVLIYQPYLIVGPVLGSPVNWFSLYIGAAVVIEALALIRPLFKRRLLYGLVSGLGVATVGLWLESFWIDAVDEYPWPTSIWPEALTMSIPAAVLLGGCGALIGMVLTNEKLPSKPISIGVVVLAVVAVAAATADGLRYETPQNASATFVITEAPSIGTQKMATADIRINPPGMISDDPNWVSILSWQGGIANQRGLFIDHLRKVGPGHYESTVPMPVSGEWKTLLRVQDGPLLTAVPIYLHGDPGIGAAEVPALSSMTRPFVSEITILQRERSPDIPQSLWWIACVTVLICTLVLIAGLSWGAGRLNKQEPTPAKTELEPSGQA